MACSSFPADRSARLVTGASPRAATNRRGSALIVDDEPANRFLLSLMLEGEGFRTLEAQNGEEAIRLFDSEPPDIVFMDIMMPGMDGYEATRRIKEMAGVDFVPVIFLTGLKDEESLMRAIQAGGDDFLAKPFVATVLKSRILAMERVRDLQRTLAAKQLALSSLLEQDLKEQALAERVLARAVSNHNVAIDHLALIQRPATIFNGDLVLTAYLPGGGLRVLVGDFTGHGLAATIGALPVAGTFHAMTRKGMGDAQLLSEINRKLYQTLPADHFMAACLISIPCVGEELRWWNGGMPSAWLRTADGLTELVSDALPLGILPELHERGAPQRIRVEPDDRLLMISDGLLEACNQEGVMFINAGFQGVMDNWAHGAPVLPALFDAFDSHCANTEQSDDVAGVEVPLGIGLFAAPRPGQDHAVTRSGWCWSLELEDERLGYQPSIEAALKPLGLIDGVKEHLGAIETIVAELYSNAVEHGVLKLDSSMKAAPDGFDAYYQERARRLAGDYSGRVSLRLSYEPQGHGGCVRLWISDSGDGFQMNENLESARGQPRPWGRGIALVKHLCESVTYRGHGSQVDAVYRW